MARSVDRPDPTATPVDLLAWVGANPEAFAGPVANRVVHEDDDFIVMLVRGPNRRNDFHIEPHAEVFLQLRGSIQVDTRNEDGSVVANRVDEGELFVVPASVPHLPRRPADTWGLVIEHQRSPTDHDVITWFCSECGGQVNRTELQVDAIDEQLGPILDAFARDESTRTCKTCGAVHPVAEELVLGPDRQR